MNKIRGEKLVNRIWTSDLQAFRVLSLKTQCIYCAGKPVEKVVCWNGKSFSKKGKVTGLCARVVYPQKIHETMVGNAAPNIHSQFVHLCLRLQDEVHISLHFCYLETIAWKLLETQLF